MNNTLIDLRQINTAQLSGIISQIAGQLDVALSGVLAQQTAQFTGLYGDGSSTGIPVYHNLGTQDVMVSVYQTTGANQFINPNIYNTGVNGVLLGFQSAPALNSVKVVVFS